MYRSLIRCLYIAQAVCVVVTALLMGIGMVSEFIRGQGAPLALRLVAGVLAFVIVTVVTGLMTYACTWGAMMALRVTHLCTVKMLGRLPDRVSFTAAATIVGLAVLNGVLAFRYALQSFPQWKAPGYSDYFEMYILGGVMACMTVIAVCICLSLAVCGATTIWRGARRAATVCAH